MPGQIRFPLELKKISIQGPFLINFRDRGRILNFKTALGQQPQQSSKCCEGFVFCDTVALVRAVSSQTDSLAKLQELQLECKGIALKFWAN